MPGRDDDVEAVEPLRRARPHGRGRQAAQARVTSSCRRARQHCLPRDLREQFVERALDLGGRAVALEHRLGRARKRRGFLADRGKAEHAAGAGEAVRDRLDLLDRGQRMAVRRKRHAIGRERRRVAPGALEKSAAQRRKRGLRGPHVALCTDCASVIGSNGFGITPTAPSETKSSISRACARAVMNTTGVLVVRGRSRRCVSVVGPSITGIITSSRMRSGGHGRCALSASAPEAQLRIANSGSSPSDISTTSRMSGSSSTWRMRSDSCDFPGCAARAHVDVPCAGASVTMRWSIEACDLVSVACTCAALGPFAARAEKRMTGSALPSLSRSSGRRSRPEACEHEVEHGEVEALHGERGARVGDRVDRHDVAVGPSACGDHAEHVASSSICRICGRSRAAARERPIEHRDQTVDVDRLVEPVEHVERRRADVVAPACRDRPTAPRSACCGIAAAPAGPGSG